MSNWREKKAGQEILKFDSKRPLQVLVMKFLDDGKEATFDYNGKEQETTEFQVEFNGKVMKFSSGSVRLYEALSKVAKDLTGKRIEITKSGLETETVYTAKLIE